MLDVPYNTYVWLKALHVVAATAWVGGLVVWTEGLSFIYEADEIKPRVMNWIRRFVLRWIHIYALVAMASGVVLSLSYGTEIEPWLHAKIVIVWLLVLYHLQAWMWFHRLCREEPIFYAKNFRHLKVFPIFLFIGIVVLVVVRPF
ncbi:MAG: CopD family protein [Rhodospirillaceae bacterium]|nr:CopD family protein [Rhodospirillaceae bacterium]